MTLAPGKGFFGDATSDSIGFLNDAFAAIEKAYERQWGPDKVDGDAWIDEGQGKDLVDFLIIDSGWEKEKDNFAYKAYRLLEWGSGGYRVTLVYTNRGELKVDIRQWFDPNA